MAAGNATYCDLFPAIGLRWGHEKIKIFSFLTGSLSPLELLGGKMV